MQTRSTYPREVQRPEDFLDVVGFRTPCITHPKAIKSQNPELVRQNQYAEPVEFRDLARHVRVHPHGNDALDLARCIQYAVENVNESWLFPIDFSALVAHLGGPVQVTTAHWDREAFARRDHIRFLPKQTTSTASSTTPSTSPSTMKTRKRKAASKDTPVASKDTSPASKDTSPANLAVKRTVDGHEKVQLDGTRRSSRLVNKHINFTESPSPDIVDKDHLDSPYTTSSKKRKVCPVEDSDFVQEESGNDDDSPEEDKEASSPDSPTPTTKGRAAARKARANIKAASLTPSRKPSRDEPIPPYLTRAYSPTITLAARAFPSRQPIPLPAPCLNPERLKIDHNSIYLYSEPPHLNITDMYASAYDSSRFGGPRRSPPYRELHLLSDPNVNDASGLGMFGWSVSGRGSIFWGI
ncbi:hypothetical protein GMOD_00000042 [Pyrenophora seminiperda CCB06]|uniref:Uncharacterized protein n=1 Tax=Pyrenophora seminiperda CCB06 TaxID=1302712 RepID=A0A3M7M6I9_9PLEO|nr:hypothetical protein GMOD_00000042 [Pyrenophora seminiperda CCB06]